MNTYDAIITRRSTRNFSDKQVEKEKLDKIIEVGRFAPTGSNSQTNHFLVIQNKDVMEKLNELVQNAFAEMEIQENMYISLKNSISKSKKGKYYFSYKAPILIIVANQKDYGNNVADCAIAIENMMIESNELDLGSCYINQLKWLNENTQILEYLRNLGLKENERVYGTVVIGYANTNDGTPNRESVLRTGNEVTFI